MTSGTRETPITFSALYTGTAVGVVLGAVYLTALISPTSASMWWSTASGYLIGGLLFLTGAMLIVVLPVWLFTRRVSWSEKRRMALLGAAALYPRPDPGPVHW